MTNYLEMNNAAKLIKIVFIFGSFCLAIYFLDVGIHEYRRVKHAEKFGDTGLGGMASTVAYVIYFSLAILFFLISTLKLRSFFNKKESIDN